MYVQLCDVCGNQITEPRNETENEKKLLKAYHDGFFTLDYHAMVLDSNNNPFGFSYEGFHVCDQCSIQINKAIFESISKIREATYRPTLVIRAGAFPPEPKVMPQNGTVTPVG